jgi:hypothetical protein
LTPMVQTASAVPSSQSREVEFECCDILLSAMLGNLAIESKRSTLPTDNQSRITRPPIK